MLLLLLLLPLVFRCEGIWFKLVGAASNGACKSRQSKVTLPLQLLLKPPAGELVVATRTVRSPTARLALLAELANWLNPGEILRAFSLRSQCAWMCVQAGWRAALHCEWCARACARSQSPLSARARGSSAEPAPPSTEPIVSLRNLYDRYRSQ